MNMGNITRLINKWGSNKQKVGDELIPLIYDHLHKIAWKTLGVKSGDVTMRPTVLVHEAFLKLQNQHNIIIDRNHFYAIAALTMRHIMVDFVRQRQREKRGGTKTNIQFNDSILTDNSENHTDIIALNDALNMLENQDPRKSSIIEQHYFAGLNYEEIAQIQSISVTTVGRELKFAKAWLANKLK